MLGIEKLWSIKGIIKDLGQGAQTHFHQGPHQSRSCLQKAEIILALNTCNYSLTVKELKLHLAFFGAH